MVRSSQKASRKLSLLGERPSKFEQLLHDMVICLRCTFFSRNLSCSVGEAAHVLVSFGG